MVPCTVSMCLLSFFSLSATVFLLLEAICIAQRLVPHCMTNCSVGGGAGKVGLVIAAGFVVPLIYTLAAVPALSDDLAPTSPKRCWLNLDSPVVSTLVIPTVLVFVMTFCFLMAAIFATSDDVLLEELRNRYVIRA